MTITYMCYIYCGVRMNEKNSSQSHKLFFVLVELSYVEIGKELKPCRGQSFWSNN
jgi:hypothetical protein